MTLMPTTARSKLSAIFASSRPLAIEARVKIFLGYRLRQHEIGAGTYSISCKRAPPIRWRRNHHLQLKFFATPIRNAAPLLGGAWRKSLMNASRTLF